MALDVQGPSKVRPYVDKAGATFTTVVDEENLLGRLYGFKAIPNGFIIDPEGIVRYKALGSFDIRQTETAEIVRRWADEPGLIKTSGPTDRGPGPEHTHSNECLLQGLVEYRAGNLDAAVSHWRRGIALDPDNYILRKQIWAVENPDKFYAGDVDYDWQAEQMDQGL